MLLKKQYKETIEALPEQVEKKLQKSSETQMTIFDSIKESEENPFIESEEN